MSSRPTSTRPVARLCAAAGAASLLVLSVAGPASAHVTVTPSTTAAGAYTVLTFSNGHGCEGSPTTKVTISIPEGINAATPTRQDFYDVSKQLEKLDPPVDDGHGGQLTERVDTVTYEARTPLPDGYRDAFEVQVQIPADAEGQTLSFPTIQTCEQGETAWIEIPAAGQSADELDSPAPSFVVTATEGDGHGEAAAAEETSETSETSATSATSELGEGSTDDDGNGLAIAGLVAGVLGIVVAGVALARTRRTA